MTKLLHLNVRNTRELTDPDVPCREENFTHGYFDWTIPVEQTAMVLVDCWAKHPVLSFCDRAEIIARDYIRPAVQACRQAGVAIVHAPAPNWAQNYKDWYASGADSVTPAEEPDWPPSDFRRRVGAFAMYAEQCIWNEPMSQVFRKANPSDTLRILDSLEPEGDDVVITTGEHMHRFCRDRKIVHLIYAGFATNICVQFRDYGMRPMASRGYNVMLVRDATMGIEFADTLENLGLTNAAIHNIEMKVGPSVTSAQLQDACAAVSCQDKGNA